MTKVSVRVLFFGMLRDIVGRAEDRIEVVEGARLESVFERYAQQFPRLGALKSSIVLASNHQFCEPSAAVSDGDEIAFLPPVSGGSGRYTQQVCESEKGHFFAPTPPPLHTPRINQKHLRGEDGAG